MLRLRCSSSIRKTHLAALHESAIDAVDGSSTGTPWMWALLRLPRFRGRAMQTVTTIGFDIAKSVFQVHGVDAAGEVVVRRQLKRRSVLAFFRKLSPCLIGIEACASSHHWSRELQALGHTVRLMPPAYVKPYVKRQKNDAADAEAICEAVTRATMRFVPKKTPEQQSCLMLHRTRHLLIRQQTAVINSIRAPALSRRSGVKLRNCCMLLLTQAASGCLRLPVHTLPRSALNCSASRSRLWSSIG